MTETATPAESDEFQLSWPATIAVLTFVIAVTVVGAISVQVYTGDGSLSTSLAALAPAGLAASAGGFLVHDLALNLTLLIPLALGLVLERVRPADPTARRAWGYSQDVVWTLASAVFALGAVALVRAVTVWLVIRSGLQLQAASWLPLPVAFVLGFVLTDLVRYVGHRIRHRNAYLWQFHAVHHAQGDLNVFTEHRVHPFEVVLHYSMYGLMFALVDVSWEAAAIAGSISIIWTRFYHSNVRLNLGPLRHVFVTPQSHRVHHSVQAEHHDANFGTIFSVWDRLFGTAHPDHTSYPRAGTDDGAFPGQRAQAPQHALKVFVGQLVYPFVGCARLWRLRRSGAGLTVPVLSPSEPVLSPSEPG